MSNSPLPSDGTEIQRMRDEAAALGIISHPNLCGSCGASVAIGENHTCASPSPAPGAVPEPTREQVYTALLEIAAVFKQHGFSVGWYADALAEARKEQGKVRILENIIADSAPELDVLWSKLAAAQSETARLKEEIKQLRAYPVGRVVQEIQRAIEYEHNKPTGGMRVGMPKITVELDMSHAIDRCDIDNMESALFDALKKALVIRDDLLIQDHRGRKAVDAERPRFEVTISPLSRIEE